MLLTSLSAAILMNTGDTVYDDYMNATGRMTITVKASYLATEVLATTTVNPVTNGASVSQLQVGSYLFTVSRNGNLIRDMTVTVAGDDTERIRKTYLQT